MAPTKASSSSLLLLLLALTPLTASSTPTKEKEAVFLALNALALARSWASAFTGLNWDGPVQRAQTDGPWADCAQLYINSEARIRRLAAAGGENDDPADARAWLSGALAGHATCVAGLLERNVSVSEWRHEEVEIMLRRALATLPAHRSSGEHLDFNGNSNVPSSAWAPAETSNQTTQWSSTAAYSGILTMWDASTQNADIVVAQDGSGNYRTINEAVAALHREHSADRRAIVYVRSGIYSEYVEIARNLRNVMFVGDGIDKTIVTGNRNVPDGYTTYRSATFGVAADGFWARDMTFENTAGPWKHQAVALRVESDHSIFYRCSFKAYQDTLFAHSQRQFYRDCHIYGTVDFIFGNAAVVIQNCEIFVRKPMGHQSNMITAQGRDNPNQSTGISIHSCRVRPSRDLEAVKESFKSYLGRPWQKYSRTVFLKTDLDGLIHPEGWAEWSGDFALDTLYYGEYMNTGEGATTGRRVNWPGFHVMREMNEAAEFSVERFIQGHSWIPEAGVPFWAGI